jgi:hypothetical protein
MENIDFIAWLLGWPLLISIDTYLSEKLRIKEGKEEKNINGAGTFIAIWIIGGLLTYG